MRQLPEMNASRQAEMRAFYESCGLSPETIARAISLKPERPFEEQAQGRRGPRKKRKPHRR